MSGATKIEWTDNSWNPVSGCTKISAGCKFCYAETLANRWKGGPAFPNGFDITLRPHLLNLPFKWKQPKRVFVNSMSDLFHEDIPREFLLQVFDVMKRTPQHTYQVLTKRADRMRAFCSEFEPLPNVWLGVTVENRKTMDRIGDLLKTPAALRFISAEPLLDGWLESLPAYLWIGGRIDWVILGGESGSQARECQLQWLTDGIRACRSVGAAPFVKQLGTRLVKNLALPFGDGKGGDWALWPPDGRLDDLKVREWPEVPIAQA